MKNKLATFVLSAALVIPGIIASTSNSTDAKPIQQQTQEVLQTFNTEKHGKKGEKSGYLMKLAQKSNKNSQVWKITRGNTYKIKIQQHNGNFIGLYSNINNDSIFTGKFLTGRGNTLIHFVQEDDNGYYAVHSGIMISPNWFQGEWYDISGNSGIFKLQR